MQDSTCWLCSGSTKSKNVTLRSKKNTVINRCPKCEFEFFAHNNETLLSQNQLDKTRLEAAGLDIPSIEKDFNNGYNQSESYINEYIVPEDRGRNILEIGCSWGYFLKRLQEYTSVPYGLEINPVRANYVKSTFNIQCFTSLSDLRACNIKFKKIFSFYCLEYIKEPISYFSELLSMLDDDGEIIFITPNLQDVLKDVWENNAYRNFFYDECAIGYYSLKATEILLQELVKSNQNVKFDVATRQGYSIFNHIYWQFNQRPLNNNTLVGGDQLPNNIEAAINKQTVLGESLANLINNFSMQYKKLIESNDYGNQIILKVKK